MTDGIIVLCNPAVTVGVCCLVLLSTIIVVARCRPIIRVCTVIVVFAFAALVAVRGAHEMQTIAELNQFLDRKFLRGPVGEMLFEIDRSAEAHNWNVTTQQIAILHRNWESIVMDRTTDVWAIHDRIAQLNENATNNPAHATGKPAPDR